MEKVVAFIGDSQIAYGNWNELLNRTDILNFGRAGDLTADVLARLDDLNPYFFSKIFIEVGTNDLSVDVTQRQIIHHYTLLIDKLREQHQDVEIFINSILPVQDLPNEFYQNSEILALNRALREHCKEKQVYFVDLSAAFTDDLGNLSASLTADGLHLNEDGYKIWASILQSYL